MRTLKGNLLGGAACVLLFSLSAFFYSCGESDDGADAIDGDTDADTPVSESDAENGCDGDEDMDFLPGDYESDDPEVDFECDTETQPCQNDQECPYGAFCDDRKLVCLPCECQHVEDCPENYEHELVCDNECACRPKPCLGNLECSEGYSCQGGRCTRLHDECLYGDIEIKSNARVIYSGISRQLAFQIYSGSGNPLADCNDVFWSSDNPQVVSVDSHGKITGGEITGSATISVQPIQCFFTDSIVVYNRNFPPGDFNVWLLNSTDEAPACGAEVLLNGVEAISDEYGVANFPGADCSTGCDIHVFDNRFNYFSALGIQTESNLVVVPLAVPEKTFSGAGVKGTVDFDPMPDIIQENGVHMSMTLLSYPGPLTDMNFRAVAGDPISQYMAGLELPYTMPSGLQLFWGEDTEILSHKGFRAQGYGGSRFAYAFGTYSSSEIILYIDSGNCAEEMTDFYRNVFASAYHGISDNLELDELPYVADSIDINGDGNTDDLVPDFENFTDMGDDLTVTQAQANSVEIQLGALPDHKDTPSGCAQAVHLAAGFRQQEAGFIYLGYAPYNDNENCAEEGGNCKVGENNDGMTTLSYAPQHSGHYAYQYIYLATATPHAAEMLPYSENASPDRSVVIARAETPPQKIDMPEFEPWLDRARWNMQTLTLTSSAVPESPAIRRLTLTNTADPTKIQKWEIYFSPAQGGFTLDEKPEIFSLGEAYIDSIRAGHSLPELLEGLDNPSLLMLDDAIEAYSRHYLEVP